jgi:hypothetical protein
MQMKPTRLLSFAAAALLLAAHTTSAQSADRVTSNASTGSGGGTSQTTIVNTPSNPVPATIVGVPTVRSAESALANRFTILSYMERAQAQTISQSMSRDGQLTLLSALPAGKAFVVTDIQTVVIGIPNGETARVLVSQFGGGIEFWGQAPFTSLDGVSASPIQHFGTGPVFFNLPQVDLFGATSVYVMLRGYLVDAQ